MKQDIEMEFERIEEYCKVGIRGADGNKEIDAYLISKDHWEKLKEAVRKG